MNYLEAKTVLLPEAPQPQVPLKLFAVEILAFVATAGILVRFFA